MRKIHPRLRTLTALSVLTAATQLATANTAYWIGTSGVSATTNWSDNANWSNSTGGGAGYTNNDIVFGNSGAAGAAGSVNSVVDTLAPAYSLTFTNQSDANYFHTLLIPSGIALTNANALTVGVNSTANGYLTTVNFSGAGSFVQNGANVSVKNIGSSSSGNGATATLNMTGLSNFIYNASSGTLTVAGSGGDARGGGTLTLASSSNYVTVGTLNVATGSGNGGAGGTLNLGTATNILNVGTVNVAVGKVNNGTIKFSSTTGSLRLRGTGGTDADRATLTVGNRSAGGTGGINGNLLLNGHQVDIKAASMTIGLSTANQTGQTVNGVVQFDTGIIDATTINLGVCSGNSGAIDNGTLTVGGTGLLVVSNISLINQSSGIATGTLNIFGGTVLCSNSIVKTTAAGTATLAMNGGTLQLATPASTVGTAAIPIDNLNLTNATLNVPGLMLGTTNIFVTTLTPGGATNLIVVGNLPNIYSYPANFPLLHYVTDAGADNFGVTNLPAGYTAYINNDTTAGLISLVVVSGPVPKAITWQGTPTGDWDTTAPNWLAAGSATTFGRGDFVTFDDTASGTTTVNLAATVAPTSVAVNNTAKTYTFSGSGALSGSSSLIKQGAGTLVLDNSGTNDFAGGLTLSAGTIQVGNADGNGSLGSGAITNNATLAFSRSNSVSLPNVMSGSGSLIQNGTGTLTVSGANTGFTGAVTVAQGTLKLGNSAALGTSTNSLGVTIANGGTLDLSAFAPTNIAVTVSGSGVNGNGAIINSGASVYPALSHVTLAGDATFGGSGFVSGGGRWDIRLTGSGATDPSLVSLSTGGHAYNLSKVGTNYVGICNTTIDPTLANIDLQGGTLSFQYNVTGLGNPASTLTVESGATLDLYNLTNQLNKVFVLNGNGINNTVANSAGANTVIGPVTLNGATIVSVGGSSLTLNGPIGGSGSLSKYGGSPLFLNGTNTYTGPTTVTNGLFVLNGNNHGGGLLTNTPNSTITGTGTQAGAVFVGGTLNPGAVGAAGTFTCGPLTVVPGGALVFDLSSTADVGSGINDLLQVNGDLTLNNTVVSLNLLAGLLQPGTYRLITYTGNLTGSFNPAVTLVGGGATRATVQLDTSVAGQLNLVVTGNPASLKWNSTTTSNWDVAVTANWLNLGNGQSSTFYQGDSALLDDSVSGLQTSLILNTNVAPLPLTVNSATNYSITGSGKITDGASILKQGAGTLLLGTANDFTGMVVVQGGILQVTNNASLGATNGGTVISSGASLDVCGVAVNDALNLGMEAITVSGAGIRGNGAIINSGTNSQHNALRLVTLVGDTTFGGPGDWRNSNGAGRWDIRGGGATLSTGGNAYNLTKVGSNQVSMVGAVVDTNLANIDIQQGLLGFETSTTSMGNPTNTLTVRAGAILSFYNTTTRWNKALVLYGDGVNTNVYNWSGSNTFIGPVTLNSNCVLAVNGTALTFTNVLSGSGGLVKSLSNPLYLYGANTYSGKTQIKGGTLFLPDGASIANSSAVSVTSGAALDVSGRADDTFTLARGQTLSGSGTLRGSLSAGPGTTVIAGDTAAPTLTLTNNLSLSGGSISLTLTPGGTADTMLAVSNNVSLSGVTHLYLTVTALLTAGETHTNIIYGGALTGQASNFQVHAPAGYSFDVDTTSVPNAILLRVGNVPSEVYWVGDKSGAWDTTTYNWLANDYSTSTNYANGQLVYFEDYNPTPVRTQVSLVGALSPGGVVFNNYSSSYSLTGSGKLTGGAALTLQNSGQVLLDNSGGNDYAGGTTIAFGLLQVGNDDANGGIGSGVVSNYYGTLVFNRTDNVTVSNAIVGYGSFTNQGTGTLTLAANNSSFSGQFTVARGTLRVDNSGALGDAYYNTTILPGATLDVGGPTIGQDKLALTNEPITVAGVGVGGYGAIINSSTNRQLNALRSVTLAGDTTIGGPGSWSTAAQPGRWDIRYTPTSGNGASLSTTYNPYNLTKVGSNQVSFVGVTIDATPQFSLANIDVQQGLLGFEGGTTSMGDANSNIVVHAGAAISFYNSTTPWNKVFVLYGDGTNATIFNWNGNNTMVGPVTLNGGCVFGGSAGTLTNLGSISGSGSLIKSSATTLVLGGTNTYTGNTVINDGRLTFTANSTLPVSPVFDLAGTNAVLDLNAMGGALTLGSGQTLRGQGTLWASLTANPGSTVAPGGSIGMLTITNDVLLNGTTVMELDRSTLGKSDQLSSPKSITVNGTLTVTNIGAALQAGDSFKLFSAASLSGSALSSVVLPPLNSGLAWSNSLALNGQIAVYATVSTVPTNLVCQVSGKQLTLSWPADHTGWRLVTNSVDVANPNDWYTFPGSTNLNQVILNVDPSQPKVFYRLVYP